MYVFENKHSFTFICKYKRLLLSDFRTQCCNGLLSIKLLHRYSNYKVQEKHTCITW